MTEQQPRLAVGKAGQASDRSRFHVRALLVAVGAWLLAAMADAFQRQGSTVFWPTLDVFLDPGLHTLLILTLFAGAYFYCLCMYWLLPRIASGRVQLLAITFLIIVIVTAHLILWM